MKRRFAIIFLQLAQMAQASPTQPSTSSARQPLAEVIRAAVAKIEPTIVTIETIGGAQPVARPGELQPARQFRIADGPTTGMIIAENGLIIASNFNFARDPTVITVTLSDGRRFVARLLGRDLIRRIALLKIDATGLPTPVWSPRNDLAVGQYAIACGRGLGGKRPTISCGIISALDRRSGAAVQTDAKTSPVNYGGPLIDIEGRAIGVIVPMTGEGGALAGVEWYDGGIGFAVYDERIRAVLAELKGGKTIESGRIGVALVPDDPGMIPLFDKLFPQYRGVKVGAVAPNSPAFKAGIKPGDKIIALEDQPTGEITELQRRLSDRAAGETVTLTLRRDWETKTVHVTLARLSEISPFEATPVEHDAAPPKPNDGSPTPSTQPSSD